MRRSVRGRAAVQGGPTIRGSVLLRRLGLRGLWLRGGGSESGRRFELWRRHSEREERVLGIVQSVCEYGRQDAMAGAGVGRADLRIPPARLFNVVTPIDGYRTPRRPGGPAILERTPGRRGSASDPAVGLSERVARRIPIKMPTLGWPRPFLYASSPALLSGWRVEYEWATTLIGRVVLRRRLVRIVWNELWLAKGRLFWCLYCIMSRGCRS